MRVESNPWKYISDGRTFYFIENLKFLKKCDIIYIEKEKENNKKKRSCFYG